MFNELNEEKKSELCWLRQLVPHYQLKKVTMENKHEIACNHAPAPHQGGETKQIITADYFAVQHLPTSDLVKKNYQTMNPLEWIRYDERNGMLCTGIFNRAVLANRIYSHGHKPDDDHFLCVMDKFLMDNERPSGKGIKVFSPFLTDDILLSSLPSLDEKDEKKEEKEKPKKQLRERREVQKKKHEPYKTHFLVFLDGCEEKDKIVFDDQIEIYPRQGRAVWWRGEMPVEICQDKEKVLYFSNF
jgi:hypothetical protein